jgi:hypothetical protein
MTPEKYEALRRQVKDLVHAEMHLLEGFLTKRVMLMLEYADSIGEPAHAVPTAALNGDLVESATLAMDAYMDRNPNAAHEDYVRAALEAVWPKQPNA